MQYTIVVKKLNGDTVGEFNNFKGLRYKNVLNREGDCTFSISINDLKATEDFISLRQREVFIYKDNDLVWGGDILSYNGELTGKDDMITLHCKGFLDRFKKRYIPPNTLSFTGIDAGEIAKQILQYTQGLTNGSFGVTYGTIQTSVPRNRTDYQYTQVYAALTNLADVQQGFDFEITPLKVFKVYYPEKGQDFGDEIVFSLGKNADTVVFSNDFTNAVNQAIVLGAGFGEAQVTGTRNNMPLQVSYGLFQDLVTAKDVSSLDLINAYGDIAIVKYGLPRREYSVTQIPNTDPDVRILEVGDWVRLDASKGFIQVYDVVRILVIDVAVEAEKETVNYTFVYD